MSDFITRDICFSRNYHPNKTFINHTPFSTDAGSPPARDFNLIAATPWCLIAVSSDLEPIPASSRFPRREIIKLTHIIYATQMRNAKRKTPIRLVATQNSNIATGLMRFGILAHKTILPVRNLAERQPEKG